MEENTIKTEYENNDESIRLEQGCPDSKNSGDAGIKTDETPKVRGDIATRWKKGQSGNPAGKPKKKQEDIIKDAECEDAIKMLQDALPMAVKHVVNILGDPKAPANAKVRILEIMLDRTYGKAFQQVAIDADINAECGVVLMPKRGDHA